MQTKEDNNTTSSSTTTSSSGSTFFIRLCLVHAQSLLISPMMSCTCTSMKSHVISGAPVSADDKVRDKAPTQKGWKNHVMSSGIYSKTCQYSCFLLHVCVNHVCFKENIGEVSNFGKKCQHRRNPHSPVKPIF